MYRRSVFTRPLAAAAIFALQPLLRADAANGDPRKETLFAMFLAPCCWRQNLLVHQSPQADELRTEIAKRIAAGQSDGEIRKAFLDRYTTRILALPEGAPGVWLSWGPAAAVLAGLAVVAAFLRKSLRRTAQSSPAPVANLPEIPESEWMS